MEASLVAPTGRTLLGPMPDDTWAVYLTHARESLSLRQADLFLTWAAFY